jgi:hypothetical protein
VTQCTRVARALVTLVTKNLGWPRDYQTSGIKKNKTLSLSKAGWRCPYSPRGTNEGSLANVPAVQRFGLALAARRGATK